MTFRAIRARIYGLQQLAWPVQCMRCGRSMQAATRTVPGPRSMNPTTARTSVVRPVWRCATCRQERPRAVK